MNIETLLSNIWSRKTSFFITFFIVFTVSYGVLMALDFLPEPKNQEIEAPIDENNGGIASSTATNIDEYEEVSEVTASPEAVILPVSISIPTLDKVVPILNPASRAISDLDNALLDGVVRHPDSAHLAQDGTVFILGHSSYLPNVMNRNFQAFNGIQNLEWGDTIEVSSAEAVYVYRVDKVYRAQAADTTVPIAGTGARLTLATCNSFGSVDDRYIVEAERVEVRAL